MEFLDMEKFTSILCFSGLDLLLVSALSYNSRYARKRAVGRKMAKVSDTSL
jgi:uncharacterized membrane protein